MSEAPSPPPVHAAFAAGFSGSCLCGAVAFRSAGPPLFVYVCHCTDCRRINGTAFHTGLVAKADDFAFTAGDPERHMARADSGNTITRWFCRGCGTALGSISTGDETIVSVKAGAVTSVPAEAIVPTLQIFYESRVPWARLPDRLVTYARGRRDGPPIVP